MKIKIFTEAEKTIECYRALRNVLDNPNLRSRQQRIYEIINTYNVDISGTNIEKLLNKANLKTS